MAGSGIWWLKLGTFGDDPFGDGSGTCWLTQNRFWDLGSSFNPPRVSWPTFFETISRMSGSMKSWPLLSSGKTVGMTERLRKRPQICSASSPPHLSTWWSGCHRNHCQLRKSHPQVYGCLTVWSGLSTLKQTNPVSGDWSLACRGGPDKAPSPLSGFPPTSCPL